MWACPDCMKAMGDAEEEEDEEKALRVSDRNRGECDAIKKYWVGGKCNIIVTSKERVKLLSCLQSVVDGHKALKRAAFPKSAVRLGPAAFRIQGLWSLRRGFGGSAACRVRSCIVGSRLLQRPGKHIYSRISPLRVTALAEYGGQTTVPPFLLRVVIRPIDLVCYECLLDSRMVLSLDKWFDRFWIDSCSGLARAEYSVPTIRLSKVWKAKNISPDLKVLLSRQGDSAVRLR
ncbi:hypothetical protein V8G54_034437 [Vigna mungo]|uniref:Uncharacterized protein n=1 Tax=Vigna mungo TaxID=3915 RepID=A0AAQ3MPQ7_VIGMU